MADENPAGIGLAELIQQVKQELLTPAESEGVDFPLLAVDSVELELQVTVKKEGKGGVKIYVLEVGGGGSRDDVQKVKVTLSPLLTKEMLLDLYRKRHPEQLKEFVAQNLEGLMKTVEDGSRLGDQF
ncbi:MAG: hypothetical protein KME45_00955 [Stenomitos rutilans HA7619-LM2]|nr:hypothetical protein [Stenomitos rutilans HA7619-LM2]